MVRSKIDKVVIAHLLGIILVTWIAHFLNFTKLGLYEDDYWFIGQPMVGGLPSLWHLFQSHVLSFHQGRPLGFTLVYFVGYLAGIIGSLKPAYITEFILVATNNCLFYALASRLFRRPVIALSSALAFALIPADNTRALLTQIHVFPAITFILMAFLVYPRRRFIAYLFALASLLFYETPYLLILAAPLMRKGDARGLAHEVVLNGSIVGIILGLNVFVRRLLSDERATQMGPSLLQRSISNVLVGPIVSFSTLIAAPVSSLAQLTRQMWLPFMVSLVVILFLYSVALPNREPWQRPCLGLPRLFVLGILMMLLAYPLTLTVDASELGGRASRVHTASLIGAAILFGALVEMVCSWAFLKRKQSVVSIVLAGYFSMFVVNGLHVQSENVLSWQHQQRFWSDVVRLAPDLNEGTVILVDTPGLVSGDQLLPFDWSLPLILGQIYLFPPEWKHKPALFLLNKDWSSKFMGSVDQTRQLIRISDQNRALLFYFPWEPSRDVLISNIILLRQRGLDLVRVNELLYGGRIFKLKTQDINGFRPYPQSSLGRYLVGSDQRSGDYLQ